MLWYVEFSGFKIGTESLDVQDGMQYRYCDLMSQFKDTLLARARAAKLDSSFPATVAINGFRGYLDEFVKKLESKELPEVKVKKGSIKNKKKKELKETYVVCVIFQIYVITSSCFIYRLRVMFRFRIIFLHIIYTFEWSNCI